ncbi:acyl-CoA synthetase [Thauera linaloolentis]|uniref:Acetyl-CoA synthetase n=1 Tax=Thauera linaloolentis (strain DSM 12138 / JCM 21573 / CCUG 41526 / CIP 105981 / IAM 15112 / NBRC 102519 / 47Lol) TaxID=1123367 RepID=N6Z3Y4_THAL4|nr:acyl-CoA synthetase [Thauera linaloolentis]ENO89123.1 acetyl-CoA synthetase [Thauera linaloolentis 47Lol = DSM 12138]MCM8565730.1 acyl-CoA synthetase [Thauera linaloolentis]
MEKLASSEADDSIDKRAMSARVIPARYNMGFDACTKWAAGPDRLALVHDDGKTIERYSFQDIEALSNQTANLLRDAGVTVGTRVALMVPQRPETAYCHVAIYKSAAIAVPLFPLFGEEAIEHRLSDSEAEVFIGDRQSIAKLNRVRARLPHLERVFCVDGAAEGAEDFHALRRSAAAHAPIADTSADDPALIIYTSGTTGKSKGALHAQRVLLGHLPGVEMSHDGLGQPGDLMWTPADWSWIGGLLDVLMPAWHHGIPVLARRFEKFDAAEAMALMARHGVRNAMLPPTALKLLRAGTRGDHDYGLALRSVASGGESLGTELLDWGRAVLGVNINEFYGQTECNMVVSSSSRLFPAKPGWMGKAVPGHDVRIVDACGAVKPIGEAGLIGVRQPNPVSFLGYWNNPAATRDKFAGDFLLTGDQGEMDADGFIRFIGRDDDIITSAGYRIGPGPIEDCLLGHPAVRQAAVIGIPDPERTELVKAFVVLNDGFAGGDELTRQLKEHVRSRLAGHEYPRLIEYLDELPSTTTGKVLRRELRLR